VDLAAFERVALPPLDRPRIGGVVVVAELGRMELASAAFRVAVVELLGRDVAGGSAPATGSPMRSSAGPTSEWVRVTQATRDALPEQVVDRLVGTPRGEQQ
jgi:nucleoside-triphosphatase THEP1